MCVCVCVCVSVVYICVCLFVNENECMYISLLRIVYNIIKPDAHRPLAWFLEIALVCKVCVCVCLYVCVCVSPQAVKNYLCLNNQSNKSYCFSISLYDT